MAGPADWGAVPVQGTASVEDGPLAWGAQPVEQPGVWEDIKNTTGPSLVRGGVAFGTMIPTVADLAASGLDWLTDTKMLKDTSVGNAMKSGASAIHNTAGKVSYGPAMEKLQEYTGPLYEAKTGPGKYYQSALEFVPSALGGPGSLATRLGTSVVAGLGSQAGADVANAVGAPEWVGRLGGGVAAATMIPKMVKPATVDAGYAQHAATLENQGQKLTAGQATGSEWMKQREANLMNKPRARAEAENFNQVIGNQAAMPGATKFDQATLAQGRQNVRNNQSAVEAAEITPHNFIGLNKDLANARRDAYKAVGAAGIKPIDDAISMIVNGANGPGGPKPFSMLGQRYQFARQELQTAIDNAQNPTVKHHLSEVRRTLDNAMSKEFSPGELSNIQRQTANYSTVRRAKLEDGNATPESLRKAIPDEHFKSGNGLAPTVEAAETVLRRPEMKESTPVSRMIGTLLGMGAGKTVYGNAEALVGGILGREVASDMANLLTRNAVTRGAYFNPVTQHYLRHGVPGLNQIFPAQNTTNLTRLLAGPETAYMLPLQGK